MLQQSDGEVFRTLPKLFLRGWEARRKTDACELPSGSPEHSVNFTTPSYNPQKVSFEILFSRRDACRKAWPR